MHPGVPAGVPGALPASAAVERCNDGAAGGCGLGGANGGFQEVAVEPEPGLSGAATRCTAGTVGVEVGKAVGTDGSGAPNPGRRTGASATERWTGAAAGDPDIEDSGPALSGPEVV